MDILQTMKVENLTPLIKHVRCVNEDMPFSQFKKIFQTTKQHYFPVMNCEGNFIGIFSSTDIREVIFTSHLEDLVVPVLQEDLVYPVDLVVR